MSAPLNTPRTPPFKLWGFLLLLAAAVVLALTYFQFRGAFTAKTDLTLLSNRSGLVMDPGSKVTFNGVEIGRVSHVNAVMVGDQPKAKLSLEVKPRYIKLIPVNVDAQIKATTVFGNKYVAFTTPENPSPQRITSHDVIDVSHVTTEFNTLFETVVSLTQEVDPVKLNTTLTATAQALDGLGTRFGQSIEHGNAILADLNPQIPQLRYDTQRLADTADVYANASPDLFAFLRNAVITARTVHQEQGNLDAALMASIGFGNTGADIFERGGPYLVRGAQDLIPTSQLLNTYSPSLLCTIRNFHDVAPKADAALGGSNGYSLRTLTEVVGA
ncbi:MAG: MCE family protein, partial [Mycolicibacterium sp.]|nr:MCE family protein [Mycolicibacterium sp.]